MDLFTFTKSPELTVGLNSCTYTNHKVIYVLRKLHKINDDFEYSHRDTIEACLDQVSMRYREVKLDKSFNNFDFGIILVVSSTNSEYKILNRDSGRVQYLKISDNNIQANYADDSHLASNDQDTAYEVYPSLPYKVNNIEVFLSFIFSEYTSDLLKLVFFTIFSQSIKALFPMLTVYATTTLVKIGSISFTYYIGFLALSLSLIASISLYLQARIVQKLESESDKRAQTAVWDRLMKVDLSYINPFKSADLMMRASSISQVRTLMSSQNITSLISLVFSVIYLFEMFFYLPGPTLAILPLLIFFIITIVVKARNGGTLLSASLEGNADLVDMSNSIFKGFLELRSVNAFENIIKIWLTKLTRSLRLSYLYRQKDNSLDVLSTSFLSLAFLISFIAILSINTDLLGNPLFLTKAIGYTSALTIFGSTLSAGTLTIVNSLVSVLAYWDRAKPIAFAPIEAGYNVSTYPVSIEGNIDVNNISFSYAPDLPVVLKEYSLSVISGNINVVSIKPSEGTTTLFRVLLALYPLSSGFIHYDSHSIDNISVISLRSQVRLAPQSLNIPMGSMYTIFRGPLSLTDDSLSEFIDAFGLTSFISSLRMGIDTPLGNNGLAFPEKIRQLLSLAYACSQSPKILLIDNCLSELSIDQKLNILRFLQKKCITIVISDSNSDAFNNAMA